MKQQFSNYARQQSLRAQNAAQPAHSNASLQNLARQLMQSFSQDKPDVAKLVDCLATERQAFEQNDHEMIRQLAESKAALVQNLDQRQQQRVQWFNEAGYPVDPEQWEHSLQKLQDDTSAPLMESWRDLATELQQCQRALMVNERILHGMQKSVGRFLNILRGQMGNGQTYDASGKAQQYADYRPITKA